MDFLELAAERYSVRSYSDKPVEQGLGSVWVRLFDVNAVAKAFDMPEYIKPICLLPVGYASEDAVPYAPWHDVYRPIESFTEEL